jgi:hypothetical protein
MEMNPALLAIPTCIWLDPTLPCLNSPIEQCTYGYAHSYTQGNTLRHVAKRSTKGSPQPST